jgi:hypothetical protein
MKTNFKPGSTYLYSGIHFDPRFGAKTGVFQIYEANRPAFAKWLISLPITFQNQPATLRFWHGSNGLLNQAAMTYNPFPSLVIRCSAYIITAVDLWYVRTVQASEAEIRDRISSLTLCGEVEVLQPWRAKGMNVYNTDPRDHVALALALR